MHITYLERLKMGELWGKLIVKKWKWFSRCPPQLTEQASASQRSLGAVFYLPFRLASSPRPASRNTRHPLWGTAQKQLKCNMSFKGYNLATSALVGSAPEGISDHTNGGAECKWWRLLFSSSWGLTSSLPDNPNRGNLPTTAQLLQNLLREGLLHCRVWAVPLCSSP